MRCKPLFVAFLVAAGVLPAPPAAGHGEIESTFPKAGSTLERAPDHVLINFTEAPTPDGVVEVKDGCGVNVISQALFDDRVVHIFLRDAQPGKWSVSYRVVSAVDGHETSGGYGFTVAGNQDCSSEGGGRSGSKQDRGGGGPAAGGSSDDDGGSFPVVPVALGSFAIVGIALAARLATR
jgi:copper resistance protein C